MSTSLILGSMPAKVAIAMSGGVDSSVVAALLKDHGVEVVGLTMLLQKTDTAEDAIAVAKQLDIEHHCIDLTEKFSDQVMGYFADAYADGLTPSPCVKCNRFIKFGALMDVAKAHGAQALVTGHYARREEGESQAELHMGADPIKDQSYFLFSLTQDQIDFLRFPLAELTKEETRKLAEKYNLSVAHKADSQDICFVPDGNYVEVLKRLRPDVIKSGDIVDKDGHVLGHHEGIVHFTVGQRKGLNLGLRTGDNNAPLFVVELEAKQNRVIVGPREALKRSIVFIDDVNWPCGKVPEEGLDVTVKLRSSMRPVAAKFRWSDEQARTGVIELAEPQFGIAKGQAGVIYDGTHILGGGWIVGAN